MTQYEFRLSLRSNDPKVVFTGKYLQQFDDMRHRILSKMVDSEYPIASCLDPTKTNQEVLIALIESLSNNAAQSAYQVNLIKAIRGINITPDMLSNFGLLPAIQYSSATNIVGVAAQNENGVVLASPAIPSPSSVIADLQEIPIAKMAVEDNEDDEEYDEDEEDDDDDDDGLQMSDEEYLASKQHIMFAENVK